jgi:hypothetical protein
VVEGQLDGGRGELQMLGIDAAQGGVTQTAGRQQQQQGAVAHAAAIPGAGGGHADQGDGGGARRRRAPCSVTLVITAAIAT